MERHTFIFNDQSVNLYGFRILSAGIDLARFENNPVVKVMHRRGGEDWMPIGRAYNLRIDDQDRLLGDIEFDQEDKEAVKVEKKVKKKLLNAVSMGISERAWSEDPAIMLKGQKLPTLTECELLEISIVDVPNNSNAVKLFSDKDEVLELSGELSAKVSERLTNKFKLSDTNKKRGLMIKLFAFILGIQENGAPVVNLSVDGDPTEDHVKKGIQKLADRIVTLSGEVTTMKEAKETAEQALTDLKAQTEENNAIALVDTALSVGKLVESQKDAYIKLAKADFDATKEVIAAMTARTASLSGRVETGDADDPILKLSWDEAHEQNKLEYIKDKHPDHFEALKDIKFPK